MDLWICAFVKQAPDYEPYESESDEEFHDAESGSESVDHSSDSEMNAELGEPCFGKTGQHMW